MARKGPLDRAILRVGVVALNLTPPRAYLADTNPHIIEFYRALQTRQLDASVVRDALHEMGSRLRKHAEDYYYEIRDQFNRQGGPCY